MDIINQFAGSGCIDKVGYEVFTGKSRGQNMLKDKGGESLWDQKCCLHPSNMTSLMPM